jgi:3-phenylpropionate/cinnamic acid dioxygenase small subunit
MGESAMAGTFETNAAIRQAHIDLFNRYAHALDGRDWAALAELFTDDASFSFARSLGFGAGETDKALIEGRGQLVAMIRGSIESLSATHHLLSNHVVDINGDSAAASCYFRAYHAGKGERADLFEESLGRFDVTTVRIGSEWKIRRMHENIMIMLGTPDAFGVSPEVSR